MITAVLALVFYIFDKHAGILIAIVMPTVVAMDTDGNYSEVLVLVLFATAMIFVRKTAFEEREE